MATQSEIAAYAFGVRLSQAVRISNIRDFEPIPKAELLLAIDRLKFAVDNFVSAIHGFDSDTHRRWRDLLRNCWAIAQRVKDKPFGFSDSGFERCLEQLNVLHESSWRVLSNLPKHELWFNLGFEIVCGVWFDGINEYPYPEDPEPTLEKPPRWELDHPDHVAKLLQTLSVSGGKLLPGNVEETPLIPIPFCGLPWSPSGWRKIEAGLRELTTVAVTDPNQPFIPTALQKKILDMLDGELLKVEALAKRLGIAKRRLYGDNTKKKLSALNELVHCKKIKRHSRGGYYRPDRPPPEINKADQGAQSAPKKGPKQGPRLTD